MHLFYLQTISQKKKQNWTERERERERGRSPEFEIDSTAVWAVSLTANQAKLDSTIDLPCFSLPPFATQVTDLHFSLYPCWTNHCKTSDPPWPSRFCRTILPPPPLDWTQSPFSLPSSLNLTGFDEFFCLVLFLLCLSIEKWYYIFV